MQQMYKSSVSKVNIILCSDASHKFVRLVCNQLILSVYNCDGINPVDFNKYVHISDGLKRGLNEILFILWKPPAQWVTSEYGNNKSSLVSKSMFLSKLLDA